MTESVIQISKTPPESPFKEDRAFNGMLGVGGIGVGAVLAGFGLGSSGRLAVALILSGALSTVLGTTLVMNSSQVLDYTNETEMEIVRKMAKSQSFDKVVSTHSYENIFTHKILEADVFAEKFTDWVKTQTLSDALQELDSMYEAQARLRIEYALPKGSDSMQPLLKQMVSFSAEKMLAELPNLKRYELISKEDGKRLTDVLARRKETRIAKESALEKTKQIFDKQTVEVRKAERSSRIARERQYDALEDVQRYRYLKQKRSMEISDRIDAASAKVWHAYKSNESVIRLKNLRDEYSAKRSDAIRPVDRDLAEIQSKISWIRRDIHSTEERKATIARRLDVEKSDEERRLLRSYDVVELMDIDATYQRKLKQALLQPNRDLRTYKENENRINGSITSVKRNLSRIKSDLQKQKSQLQQQLMKNGDPQQLLKNLDAYFEEKFQKESAGWYQKLDALAQDQKVVKQRISSLQSKINTIQSDTSQAKEKRRQELLKSQSVRLLQSIDNRYAKRLQDEVSPIDTRISAQKNTLAHYRSEQSTFEVKRETIISYLKTEEKRIRRELETRVRRVATQRDADLAAIKSARYSTRYDAEIGRLSAPVSEHTARLRSDLSKISAKANLDVSHIQHERQETYKKVKKPYDERLEQIEKEFETAKQQALSLHAS